MDRNTFLAEIICDASIDTYNNYKSLTPEERAAAVFFVVEDRLPFDKICATVYRIVKKSKAADTRAALAGKMWLQDVRVKQVIKYFYKKLFVTSKKAKEKANTIGAELGYVIGPDEEPTDRTGNESKTQKNNEIDRGEALAILWKHLKRADKAGDSKTVSDISLRLEAMKFKKEQDENDESVIRRYMPLRCNICPLYQKERNAL